jgi:hypothetical protein
MPDSITSGGGDKAVICYCIGSVHMRLEEGWEGRMNIVEGWRLARKNGDGHCPMTHF